MALSLSLALGVGDRRDDLDRKRAEAGERAGAAPRPVRRDHGAGLGIGVWVWVGIRIRGRGRHDCGPGAVGAGRRDRVRRGDADAERRAHVVVGERVGGPGRAGDVRAGAAGGVAAAPLVAVRHRRRAAPGAGRRVQGLALLGRSGHDRSGRVRGRGRCRRGRRCQRSDVQDDVVDVHAARPAAPGEEREDEPGVAPSRRVAERRAAPPAAGAADAAGGRRDEGSRRPPLADADAGAQRAGCPERGPNRQALARLQVVARAGHEPELAGPPPVGPGELRAGRPAVHDGEPGVQGAPALQAALERSVGKVRSRDGRNRERGGEDQDG